MAKHTVWVITTGEYENPAVFGVSSSLKAAIDRVKRRYGYPYKVRWDISKYGPLVGYFEAVPGYSTKHTAEFEITEYDVED